ncbi:hypothetical protein C1646_755773 [Rhizophagus diaphanus]|nr:hypothetical protein C1646_755773 [Rhizophagus diaphanus] [Rhizophagus sp. MUCL 43196]
MAEEHTRHKCENDTYPIQYSIKDCQRKCSVNDHFYAFYDLFVDHFCGNEHQCLREYEQPGICKVHIEPQKQEEVYKGKVQEFTFTKYIQLSEKLKCSKKIPPNKFEHDGPHIHDDFHFCDYILPYGHLQKYDTKHGNMIQTEFTAKNDEFEYKGYKLRIGDKGTFVLCSQASSGPPNGIGYISLDGHHFTCENPSTRETAFHIILVLDRSSSMTQSDHKSIKNMLIYNRLKEKHNNRLGAVYNAVHSFLHTQLQSTSNLAAAQVQDTVSIILFNNEVIVPYENQSLEDADAISPVYLYTVLFGSDSASKFLNNGNNGNNNNKASGSLKHIAEIAQSYHSPNTSSVALRCQFTCVIDEVNLVNHFTYVADSLRRHKPALLKKNIIL